jgi:hypothetical protein
MHPEWQGLYTGQLQNETENGGRAFYQAFLKWTKKTAKTKEERKQLSEEIFTFQLNDYSNLHAIDDWIELYQQHPEWQGMSTSQIQKEKKYGGLAFYQAFSTWTKKTAKTKEERKQLVQQIFPSQRNDYSNLQTIDDWIELYQQHPEWHGLNTHQIETVEGGCAFYSRFSKWTKQVAKTEEERKHLVQQIFPSQRNDYSNLKTIDDWIELYQQHPEWHGLNTHQITRERKTGGNSFYQAFIKWTRKTTKTQRQRKKLREQIFPPIFNDYSNLQTIDDWIELYQQHPEWHGLSTHQIEKVEGGGAFYQAFSTWTKKTAKTKEERKQLVQQIFLPKINDYSNLKTIDDWIEYHAQHPEWQGMSTSQIQKEKKYGGLAFYSAFTKWLKKNTENEEERFAFRRVIFPEKRAPFAYEHKGTVVHYDSAPERTVAILLEKYGLLKKPEEGTNVHVRTNGKKQHSIDFLVDNFLIEYHPVGRADQKAGRDVYDAGQRKYDNITNPKFDDHYFIHIWEVNHLYEDVLQDPELIPKMHKRYQNLTKEQFKKHVMQARKKALEYDIAHPKKKRKAE